MTTIFDTISQRNTDEAVNLCRKNGLEVENEQDVAEGLEYLLRNSKDKDAAFATIMSLHPDKEIIVDLYTTRSDFKCGPFNDCGQRLASMKYTTGKGADGSTSNMPATTNLHPKILTSTNIILAISAIVIVIAIVSKSK